MGCKYLIEIAKILPTTWHMSEFFAIARQASLAFSDMTQAHVVIPNT
jgi:hypothetical protein